MSFVTSVKNSRPWRALIQFQRVLLVATSIFVVLIMCAAVLLRYVFKSDVFGIEEIVVIAAFWLYLIGSAYGVYERSHVKADIIPQFLSARARSILNLIIQFITAVLCVIFTVWAVDMVRFSLTWMPRTTGLRIPVVISQSSILTGYVLMSFYSIVYFLDDLMTAIAGEYQDGSVEQNTQ